MDINDWVIHASALNLNSRNPQGLAVSFQPTDLANLELWLDANAGTFQDTGLSTPANNGDPVGGWEDQSGNGNHATQATGAAKPQLTTNSVNGQATIDFDGTDDILNANAAASHVTGDDPSFTLIYALKHNVTTSGQLVYSFGRSTSLTPVHFNFMQASNYQYTRRDDSSTEYNTLGSETTDTNFNIVIENSSGTTRTSYKNGTQDVSTTNDLGTATLDVFAISALDRNGIQSNWANQNVGEVLIYSRSLTTSEMNQIGDFLAAKYGTTWTTIV